MASRLVVSGAAVFVGLVAFATSALADPPSLVTSIAAIVCVDRAKLMEGMQAAVASDKAWLEGTGCTWVPKGMPAVVIEDVPHNLTYILKVRLNPGKPNGATVWTTSVALMTTKGEYLDERGRVRAPAR